MSGNAIFSDLLRDDLGKLSTSPFGAGEAVYFVVILCWELFLFISLLCGNGQSRTPVPCFATKLNRISRVILSKDRPRYRFAPRLRFGSIPLRSTQYDRGRSQSKPVGQTARRLDLAKEKCDLLDKTKYYNLGLLQKKRGTRVSVADFVLFIILRNKHIY